LTLDPADLPARLYLADVQIRQRKGAEALATLGPVKHIGPDDAFRLMELLANAHLLERHLSEAAVAARQAMDHARTAEEKQYGARLVQSIADYSARVAESEALRKGAGAPASAPVGLSRSINGPTTSAQAGHEGTESIGMPPLTAVGRLKNVLCAGAPILEIAVEGSTLRVAVDDPLKIRVIGTGQVQAELKCGPQDVPIRVGYEPMADRARNTVGTVRLLDFSVK